MVGDNEVILEGEEGAFKESGGEVLLSEGARELHVKGAFQEGEASVGFKVGFPNIDSAGGEEEEEGWVHLHGITAVNRGWRGWHLGSGFYKGFETEEFGVVVLGFENLIPSRVNENVYCEPESKAFAKDNKFLTCFVHYCGVPFREEAMFQLSVQVFAQGERRGQKGMCGGGCGCGDNGGVAAVVVAVGVVVAVAGLRKVGGACTVGIDEEDPDGRGVFVEDCEVGVEDPGGHGIEKGLVGEDEDFGFDMLNEFVGVGKAEGDGDLWKFSGCGAKAGGEDRWGAGWGGGGICGTKGLVATAGEKKAVGVGVEAEGVDVESGGRKRVMLVGRGARGRRQLLWCLDGVTEAGGEMSGVGVVGRKAEEAAAFGAMKWRGLAMIHPAIISVDVSSDQGQGAAVGAQLGKLHASKNDADEDTRIPHDLD
ncbi:hypothetical protein CYMTET_18778 [Cymbomonas tetramitiformis]|uniref:Uncharacterized protein n=1 Tax=Cymbomonas tetramitiformis TaxID=36881 RepID=A0AAE0G7B9_9CHLO|nr:hypothetical protein CYMTET_18778 [Cymbomonas tetramitiformis]